MAKEVDINEGGTRYEVLTPTWLGVLPIYEAVLRNPDADGDGLRAAMGELRNMAGLADAHNETIKNMKEPTKALVSALVSVITSLEDPDRHMEALIALYSAACDVAERLGADDVAPIRRILVG